MPTIHRRYAKKRAPGIDLGLEIIEALRQPGVRLSSRAIAEICGCSHQRIDQIFNDGLAKLRRHAQERQLVRPA